MSKDSDKAKAFEEAVARRKRETENDAARQRKRAMSPDEKRARAVELQTEKYIRFYRTNGTERSEEDIRRELAKRAERRERQKAGE